MGTRLERARLRAGVRRRSPSTGGGSWADRLAALWARARSLVLNVVSVAIFAFFVHFLVTEATRPTIDIRPIPTPKEMVESGLTGEAMAELLRGALADIVAKAKSVKQSNGIRTPLDALAITVPGTGVSADVIAGYLGGVFGVPSRWTVAGHLAEIDGDLRLVLTTGNGQRTETFQIRFASGRAGAIDRAMATAAEKILAKSDPYILAVSLAGTRPVESIALLDAILTDKSTDPALRPWAHNLLGNILARASAPDRATKAYEAALALDPGFALAHNGLANAFDDLDRFDDAKAHFEAAIRHKSDYAVAYNGLGLIYSNRYAQFRDHELYKLARTNLEKAISIDKRYPSPHYNLGRLHHFAGEHDDALRELFIAFAIDPFRHAHRLMLSKAMKEEARVLAARLKPPPKPSPPSP